MFVQFYDDRLGSKTENRGHVSGLIIKQGPMLTEVHRKELIQPFGPHDVKEIVFKINKIRSPGPDGFGSGFYLMRHSRAISN